MEDAACLKSHCCSPPRLEPAAPGSVAFVLDTSGSVPSSALDAVTAELEAYLRGYPATTLEVLYADAQVTGRATYTAADLPLRLEPKGGGTRFGPALSTLTEADETPACIVYLTDLRGSFPEDPPPMPVIWLVFGQPLAPPHSARSSRSRTDVASITAGSPCRRGPNLSIGGQIQRRGPTSCMALYAAINTLPSVK
jgi:hypothetical protein